MSDDPVRQPPLHRQRPSSPRARTRLLLVLRSIPYMIMIALIAVMAFVGVAAALDRGQPRYWGTFEQTDCEPRARGGCRIVGNWLSEDGSIRLENVDLDGGVDDSGTVRASYRPTGIITDADNNIVHAEAWADADLWVPWVCCAVTALAFCGHALRRGDLKRPRRWRSGRSATRR